MQLSVWQEFIDLSVIALPTLLVLALTVYGSRVRTYTTVSYNKIMGQRVGAVLGAALCTVLAIGFGLTGLTKACFPEPPVCPQGQALVAVHGSAFGAQRACQSCGANGTATAADSSVWALHLNQARPVVLIVAVITNLLVNTVGLLAFARWAVKAPPV